MEVVPMHVEVDVDEQLIDDGYGVGKRRYTCHFKLTWRPVRFPFYPHTPVTFKADPRKDV